MMKVIIGLVVAVLMVSAFHESLAAKSLFTRQPDDNTRAVHIDSTVFAPLDDPEVQVNLRKLMDYSTRNNLSMESAIKALFEDGVPDSGWAHMFETADPEGFLRQRVKAVTKTVETKLIDYGFPISLAHYHAKDGVRRHIVYKIMRMYEGSREPTGYWNKVRPQSSQ